MATIRRNGLFPHSSAVKSRKLRHVSSGVLKLGEQALLDCKLRCAEAAAMMAQNATMDDDNQQIQRRLTLEKRKRGCAKPRIQFRNA